MADLSYEFVEDAATRTVEDSDNWTDTGTASSTLTAGNRYLLIVNARWAGKVTWHVYNYRVYDTTNGAELTGSHYKREATADSDAANASMSYSYATIFTAGSSGGGIKTQMKSDDTSNDEVVEQNWAGVLLIDLTASKLAEDYDYFFNESTTTVQNTTSYSVTSRATKTITFNEQNGGEWLVIGSIATAADNDDVGDYFAIKNVSTPKIGVDILRDWPEAATENEDLTETTSHIVTGIYDFASATYTSAAWSIESKDGGVPGTGLYNDHLSSRIIGLRLDSFASHVVTSSNNGTVDHGTGGFVTVETLSLTAPGSGTDVYLVIGGCTTNPDNAANYAPYYYQELDLDSSAVNNAAWQSHSTHKANDDNIEHFELPVLAKVTIASGATGSLVWGFKEDSAQTTQVRHRGIAAIKVDGAIAAGVRHVWDGSGSGSLEAAANWSTSAIPTPRDDVIFSANGTNAPSTGSLKVTGAFIGNGFTQDIGASGSFLTLKPDTLKYHRSAEGNAYIAITATDVYIENMPIGYDLKFSGTITNCWLLQSDSGTVFATAPSNVYAMPARGEHVQADLGTGTIADLHTQGQTRITFGDDSDDVISAAILGGRGVLVLENGIITATILDHYVVDFQGNTIASMDVFTYGNLTAKNNTRRSITTPSGTINQYAGHVFLANGVSAATTASGTYKYYGGRFTIDEGQRLTLSS